MPILRELNSENGHLYRNHIIAFHGLQGSGKTTWADFVFSALEEQGYPVERYNIKDTFSYLASGIYHHERNTNLLQFLKDDQKLLAWKELQKAISTWAEKFDKEIWSSRYSGYCMASQENIVTDDLRLPQNCDALLRLSNKNKKVIVFKLEASEEVRRKRCEAWRETGCVLSELLPKPEDHPETFHWVDINTEEPKAETRTVILRYLSTFIEGFDASV